MKKTLIKSWKLNYRFDTILLKVFEEVKREDFVLKAYKKQAYSDIALPILVGQTISQPTTVMIMLQELEIKKGQTILEIGTGSGYQTALLSKLVGEKGNVISLEIIPQLLEFAKKNLKKLNLKNVKLILSDGSIGYSKYAPYDRIVIAAASPDINQNLIDQLSRSGIMILPVGNVHGQKLMKVKKNHSVQVRSLGDFLFVPLMGKHGY